MTELMDETALVYAFKEELNKDFENENGYKFPKTHFKIGRGLHGGTYYHLKKFFEIGANCELAARLLALVFELPEDGNVTLVSYGAYTNLLLSKSIKYLKLRYPKTKIDYAIAYHNQGEELTFQFDQVFHENIIIILPAVNTLGRLSTLEAELKRWFKKKYPPENGKKIPVVQTQVYAVVFFKSLITGNSLLNWNIDEKSKTITARTSGPVNVRYLVPVDCDCYKEEECPLCFFEKSDLKTDALQERYFFQVNPVTEAPKLIFNLPRYGPAETEPKQVTSGFSFEQVFKMSGHLAPNYYGHINDHGLSCVHFIKTDQFYASNRRQILDFFSQQLKDRIFNNSIDELVIITTRRDLSSSFLEELAEEDILKNLKITIISYKPFDEYAENFEAFYGKYLYHDKIGEADKVKNTRLVVYYSDIIYSGGEFKQLNTFLKRAKDDYGFDMCWSLIDRSDAISKVRILRRLHNEGDFLSFFKLNVPVNTGLHFENPIDSRFANLQHILMQCHLDALKTRVINELRQCVPQTIYELGGAVAASPQYFYFVDPGRTLIQNYHRYRYYSQRFSRNHEILLKLRIFHEVSTSIHQMNYVNSRNTPLDIAALIETLSGTIALSYRDENPEYDPDLEKRLIYDHIIKLFTRAPFYSFELIYHQIFRYSIQQLDTLVNNLSGKTAIGFSQFRALKFFIRRSVELNSNYIISEKFLSFLKYTVFSKNFTTDGGTMQADNTLPKTAPAILGDKLVRLQEESDWQSYRKVLQANFVYVENQLAGFRHFLAYCFKELIIANPARAIKLEGLINSKKLLPPGLDGKKTDLKTFLQNKFYAMGRVLKSENIVIYSIFRDWYIKSKREQFSHIDAYQRDITTQFFSGEPIRSYEHQLLLRFLENSKHINEGEAMMSEIKKSLSWMLAISAYINKISLDHDPALKNSELNIKHILESICKMLSTGWEKSYQFLLLIEYQHHNGKSLFYTLSSDPQDFGHMAPDEKGLAFHLFSGLLDEINGNIQTFIPVIRTGDLKDKDTVHSFNINFHTAGKKKERVRLLDAFIADHKKYNVIRNANMFEYFRLSDIAVQSGDPIKGKAVLVLCSDENPDIENFKRFQNIEKLRLLLLIKEDLLQYIRSLIDNDNFTELLLNNKKMAYARSMKHGLERYFDILRQYIKPADQDFSSIITAAITGQVLSKFGVTVREEYLRNLGYSARKAIESDLRNRPNDTIDKILNPNLKPETITLERDDFECRVRQLCMEGHFGGRIIDHFKFIFDGAVFPLCIEKVIFDVVLTEVILNMKKYYPEDFPDPEKRFFRIDITPDKWIFINRALPFSRVKTEYDIEPYSGLHMIREVLRDLEYPGLEIKFTDYKPEFALTINLIKNA